MDNLSGMPDGMFCEAPFSGRVEVIAKLAFDEAFYQDAVARTHDAARIYDRDGLARRYVDFFVKLLAAPVQNGVLGSRR